MLPTRFPELVGCRLPLQLAGMPGVVTPELAIAVAGAGALAMLPAAGISLQLLQRTIDEVSAATRTPIGVNVLVPFLDRAVVETAAARVRVVEFFYGEPDAAIVAAVHAGGALAGWQVGSRPEAVAAEKAGCDFVIAQGVEAGGHVRGSSALLPLLAAVLDAVKIPVVAAGGIASARSMAAALAAGASAVRVGTRFVASVESGAHPDYVASLVAATAEDTELTTAFSVMWPDAPHRVLRSCIEAAEAIGDDTVATMLVDGQRVAVPRLAVPVPDRETEGRIDAMALYAGQSVGAIDSVLPAAAIVRELCDGAAALLAAHR